MNILNKLKRLVEFVTGTTIYRKLPFGQDALEDIKYILPNYQFNIIFDIGANIGQSSYRLAKTYSNASIYSFEPIKNTFEALKKKCQGQPNVTCYQIAFGSVSGSMKMSVDGNLTMSKIDANADNFEEVSIVTLDEFMNKEKLSHINFLKIDTEGFDLEVLKGSSATLDNGLVDILQVEVGMNPLNNYHVPLERIKLYLEEKNFYLFGIYGQVQEWIDKKPILRVCDAVFIHKKVVDKHTPVVPSWF